MAFEANKARIIEAIKDTEDERVLFAINRLLQLEETILQWHADILNERLADAGNGNAEFSDWEDVKTVLFKNAE